MCGTETLTMVMSSTSMKVLKATAMVSRTRAPPCSGFRGVASSAVAAIGSTQCLLLGRLARMTCAASASALAAICV